MLSSQVSSARSCEGGLQGVDEWDSELVKHRDSAAAFLAFGHRERAVLEDEVVKLLGEDHGKQRGLHLCLDFLAAYRL